MMRRTTVLGLSVASLIFSVVAAATIGNAYAGQTTRVSVSSAGVLANTGGTNGVLSADGNYVVFQSSASNLHPSANGIQQVYRHDRTTGETVLVSAATSGDPGNNVSRDPSVSANGDYVVFSSFATDLVASDTNGVVMDVFRRDMRTGATVVVSTSSTGVQGDLGSGLSGLPGARAISDLGRFVVFTSFATNLVAGANASQQVYVKDMVTQEVVRASVNNDGDAGNAGSERPVISGDGEVVAFSSTSTNLSPVPTFGYAQVFVHDRGSRATTLESVATSGLPQFARHSAAPALSSDGRYVAFESEAVLHADDLDNGTRDVYLRDRVAPGSTVLASLSNNTLSGAHSIQAAVSADGRWVGFASLEDLPAAGDMRRQYDVYVYDRTSQAVTLVSLNDDGVQANMQSLGPSLSDDGGLVLFVSAASNLVAEPSNGFMQLYVRRLASSVPPSVNLPSTLDVAFSTLDTSGTFTDPDANETYVATVDYGDGSAAQELDLAGASFQLHHVYAAPGTYPVVVTVTDSNGGEGSATLAVSVLGYSYEWLDPLDDTFVVGRNLPVKFRLLGPDGSSVLDQSVQVDVIDASGVVAGPYVFGDQPSRSVVWSSGSYHVNVDTRDLAPGMYWLRVRFASPTITGEFTLATNGVVGATRSGLR
jgi:Tol biopolymer transport system component